MSWIHKGSPGPLVVVNYISHRYKPAIILAVDCYLASIASVSVWFQSKELPRDRIFRFARARNGTRANPIFCPVFDSRFLFFGPKLHGNACCAGYTNCYWRNRPLQVLCPVKISLLHSIPKNIDLTAKPEKKNNRESFCNKWKTVSH